MPPPPPAPSSPPAYWAFISYSHADDAWGRWLHRALESYRIPRALVGQPGLLRCRSPWTLGDEALEARRPPREDCRIDTHPKVTGAAP